MTRLKVYTNVCDVAVVHKCEPSGSSCRQSAEKYSGLVEELTTSPVSIRMRPYCLPEISYVAPTLLTKDTRMAAPVRSFFVLPWIFLERKSILYFSGQKARKHSQGTLRHRLICMTPPGGHCLLLSTLTTLEYTGLPRLQWRPS